MKFDYLGNQNHALPHILLNFLKNSLIEDLEGENRTTAAHAFLAFPLIFKEIVVKKPSLLTKTNDKNQLPIHLACALNAEKSLEFILDFQPTHDQINLQDSFGKSPLHYAAEGMVSISLVRRMVIEFWADPTILDEQGQAPYFYSQNPIIGKILLRAYAKRKQMFLFDLIESGHFPEDSLLKITGFLKGSRMGHDIIAEFLDACGWKPDLGIVASLLRSGKVDINCRSEKWGDGVLHRCSDPTIFAFLLQNGADNRLLDNDLNTPLHCASSWECAEMLLKTEARADLYTRNAKGQLPLHTRPFLLRLFLLYGMPASHINDQGSKGGFTPVHVVCKNFHWQMTFESLKESPYSDGQKEILSPLEFLDVALGIGADLFVADHDKRYPLHQLLSPPLVAVLKKHKFDLKRYLELDTVTLQRALRKIPTAQLAIESGCEINLSEDWWHLLIVQQGDDELEALEFLLKSGRADPNSQNEDGCSSLWNVRLLDDLISSRSSYFQI